jgi:streptogramin lyase
VTTHTRKLALVLPVLAVGLSLMLAAGLHAQPAPPIALAGRVSSVAEGLMEGVLVTARKPGSNVAVTVVSDARGRYRFPVSHMAPGTYGLTIRAAGYDLASAPAVTVAAGKTTNDDLRLVPTKDLEDQLSNGEWMISAPGTDADRIGLLECTTCHSLQRVMDSYHTAADFRTFVLPRMAGYANQSFWLKPQPYPTQRTNGPYHFAADLPEFLARINQSTGPRTWPLKTFPRLKGASTHIIVTQYDIPDRLAQPHDVIGTPDGTIWYSDFGQQFLGELNPRTGHITEIPVPANKPGYLTGALDVEADPSGDLWLANLYQGAIARYDPKTRTFTTYPVQPADHPEYTQDSMVAPTHDNLDGKVWTNNQDNRTFWQLDTATGTWARSFGPLIYPDTKKVFSAYGIVSDDKNSLWMLDFGGTSIAHLDPKTGAFKIIPTPTADSHPRRGRINDRTGLLWFAEFGANQVGSYDTRADNGVITEYKMPTPWDSPYDAVSDKNGNVWTGSTVTDRVSRLDPATGRVIEYQLPTSTNIRRVWVDNSTTPVTFWTGSNHGADIIRIEPQN